MRRILAAALFFTSSISYAETAVINIPQLQQEAKEVIQQLAITLAGRLKKAKEQGGGIEEAVKACYAEANVLTAKVSNLSDWQISRTSEKLRNPTNVADEWERSVLEQFAKRANIGANIQTLAFSQVVVDVEGKHVFRMMKAIPMAAQCLGCHGDNIDPTLAENLDSFYPLDNARGFKVGELRGAFSLKKQL